MAHRLKDPSVPTPSTGTPDTRTGENGIKRHIIAWGLLGVQIGLVVLVSVSILYFVDGLVVGSNSRQYLHGYPRLQASDITTAISAALVIVRLVTNTWVAVATWRCVYILLEKTGLSLPQLNSLVAHKVPLKFPGSSGYSWLITAVLVLMLPAQLAAPLVSGAVGWNDMVMTVGGYYITSSLLDPASASTQEYWAQYLNDVGSRYSVVSGSTIYRGWLFPEESVLGQAPCRRVMWTELAVNSTIDKITIPCLEIHSIKWDSGPLPDSLTNLVDSPGLTVLDDNNPNNTSLRKPARAKGTGLFMRILDLPAWSSPIKYSPDGIDVTFPSPTRFTGTLKIAYMVGFFFDPVDSPSECETSAVIEADRERGGEPKAVYLDSGPDISVCYVFATINFTAGSTHVGARVVSPDLAQVERGTAAIDADLLTEETLNLMNDVMELMGESALFETHETAPIEQLVEMFFTRSFAAAWGSLDRYLAHINEGRQLPANKAITVLIATVNRWRVMGWLLVNLLLTLSGVILMIAQSFCDRPVVVDTAAAAIMTNVQAVLENDMNCLCDLSFLTKQDERIGTVTLRPQQEELRRQFALVPTNAITTT